MPILKKIFFLSLTILLISLLFWGVYKLSFAPKKAAETPPETPAAEDKTPQKVVSGISAISDEAIIAPVITTDGNYIKYYSKTSGKAYQIDLDGKGKTILSNYDLPGLIGVLWSPDRSKVVSEFSGSDGKTLFSYYDYNAKKGFSLSQNIDQVAWQSSGNKILYKYWDPQKKIATLNISDPDGKNWNKITQINYNKISIAPVPKSGLVSFWNEPDSFVSGNFESAPVIAGEKKTILSGSFGADFLWSPDGNLALVSRTSAKGGSNIETATVNFNGGEYKNLNFPTFASKCVWAKDSRFIYCALPGGMPATAVLPNEYKEGKFKTTDTFWKVDITSGEKTRIIDLDKIKGQYDATNLFMNSDESMLFFTNRVDGKLYRLNF